MFPPSSGAQNRCAKFILSCMKCCFWCLEKFINRNAYIMVSLTSWLSPCVADSAVGV